MRLPELVICDAGLDGSGRYRTVVVYLFLEVERRFLRELLVAGCVHYLHLKLCLGLIVYRLLLLVVELVRYWILQRLRGRVPLGPFSAL